MAFTVLGEEVEGIFSLSMGYTALAVYCLGRPLGGRVRCPELHEVAAFPLPSACLCALTSEMVGGRGKRGVSVCAQ
jgi:hypothetical protein